MAKRKQVIGGEYISRGRKLSLSKAVRAGDFVYLTGQVPRQGDQPMTTGTIEEQTRVALEAIEATLREAGCALSDVVKAMVWLRDRTDFGGFNSVFAEYFPTDPPARSAVLSQLLVDGKRCYEALWSAYAQGSNSSRRLMGCRATMRVRMSAR